MKPDISRVAATVAAATLVVVVSSSSAQALVWRFPLQIPSQAGAAQAAGDVATHGDSPAATDSHSPRKRHATKSRAKSTSGTTAGWATTTGKAALASAIGGALANHTRGGEWGAIVVSLTRGDTLFEENADTPLEPASTMKMYTSAVTL